jgi:hypothetical protein
MVKINTPWHACAGTEGRWVVSSSLQVLYPQERPSIHCTGGWAGLGAILDCLEILTPRPSSYSIYSILAANYASRPHLVGMIDITQSKISLWIQHAFRLAEEMCVGIGKDKRPTLLHRWFYCNHSWQLAIQLLLPQLFLVTFCWLRLLHLLWSMKTLFGPSMLTQGC